VTLPASSVNNSRAIAPGITVSLPVSMAGKIMAWLELKAEAVIQPRPVKNRALANNLRASR
jgi:hypothetical protein